MSASRAPRLGSAAWGPLVILLAVTVIVPAIVFDQFRRADDQQRELLLRSIRHQGTIVVRTLSPLFERPVDEVLPELAYAVARIDPGTARIRVFVRRLDGQGGGFFYVATNARLLSWQMATERREILSLGVLAELEQSCEGGQAKAAEYRGEDGSVELITSIAPYKAEGACWVVLLSHNAAEYGAAAVRSTWDSPQVHAALALYVTMVIAAAALISSVLVGVSRMARAARRLREAGGEQRFDDQSQLPQLAAMARELDSLVAALRRSADDLRQAAEENAHALKAPVATIRHAAEGLERDLRDPEARHALDLVLRATDRLGDLVQSIRRLDVAAADALAPDLHPLDLATLLRALARDYRPSAEGRGVAVEVNIDDDLRVMGDTDLLETVFENLIDNALGFSPTGTTIELQASAAAGRIEVRIRDQGPGVPDALLERIFERHVSIRPETGDEPSSHFGIGLWICRRHLAAHGGSIHAANRPGGGLELHVSLPAAA